MNKRKDLIKYFLKFHLLKKRRIYAASVLGIIVCISAVPTYSYFVHSSGNIEGSNGDLNMDIQNGDISVNVDAKSASWKDSSDNNIVESNNPTSSEEITYGPIYVDGGNSNLTTKVDLLSEYKFSESIENNWNVGKNLCDPFEVIVGDIDNFGFNPSNTNKNYDAYNDGTTIWHNMDLFPGKYDAEGTDRRMVPSAFYNYYKAGRGNMPLCDSAYFKYGDYYCDGYTERAALRRGQDYKRVYNDSLMMDGADWRSLQCARPITFKYGKIPDDKDIESVTFQVFTDDIQSSSATKGATGSNDFSRFNGDFDVYIIAKDKQGYEIKQKVDEFSEVINDYAQSGPKGNMRTLKLPGKYFNIIKEASGLDSGLKLLIDNEKSIKGDSYAIDFAKMTVNSAASSTTKIVVHGKVTDNLGNGIAGADIFSEDGAKTVTEADGTYNLETTIGILKIKASKKGYADSVADFGIVYEDSDLTNKNIKMSSIEEKYAVDIVATKCDKDGSVIEGEDPIVFSSKDVEDDKNFELKYSSTAVKQAIKLEFSPKTKYKLEYRVRLKDKESIDPNNNFTLGFHLENIKARATQENNGKWLWNGTGNDYKTIYKVDLDSNNEENSKEENSSSSNDKTNIYFEIPDTKNDDQVSNWWLDETPTIYMDSLMIPNVSKVSNSGNYSWYTGQTDAASKNSVITVFGKDKNNSNINSGKLYWFNTKKIYICTN